MFQQLHADKTGATIRIRVLTKDDVEEAIAIQQESMRQECIAVGVGVYEEPGGPEGMIPVFREVVKDGCTLIAVDDETEEVVAVAFNKLFVPVSPGEEDPFGAFVETNVKKKSCLDLISFLESVESQVNIYERYEAKGIMEIFYVGTRTEYQGRGIGELMIRSSVDFARDLMNGKSRRVPVAETIANEDVVPQAIFGVFASNYSQRIAERLSFEWLAETVYDDHRWNGKKMSERIGDVHKSAKLGALKL